MTTAALTVEAIRIRLRIWRLLAERAAVRAVRRVLARLAPQAA